MTSTVRVHATLSDSRANGPGERFVVWFQGCSLACPGCFNPETHGPDAEELSVAELAGRVLARADRWEGITLTGGEPLQQPEAVAELCRRIREGSRLGVLILTGYTRGEIEADPARLAAVADADLVIAGRYNAGLRLGTGLRGSSNKTYWWLTDRYREADLAAVPEAEVRIGADGTLIFTGMEAA
ncbi:4Fe-4S single cluster domain-containing protein [Stackebrandtia nassauensis]|uniref:Anaerobic ribonucleoside-triphosphate reductase-activating protein n=1 Tax=Stackebrandtia nassauensis (strain DSM 44728 / CIP 108903 / NRRL B-16338 / NBRC 102104 / LLR-40K-21) TaxID=446470 RepID=D3QC28_STANL|nr:4Fe-4S single cluster domain-containing protein [Stackebrandtia nassauensis]ADD44917.1 Radical SAM domain protein [Stackebrandtia nassauensis DSM 44728]